MSERKFTWLVSQSVGRSVGRSVGWSVGQSVDPSSLGHKLLFVFPLTNAQLDLMKRQMKQ